MAYETILSERRGQQDGVLWITLNRPDRLNALVPQLYAELNQELLAARDDRSVRCIVITGAGRGFCAGADHKAGSGRESDDAALDLEGGRMGLIKNAQAFINLRKVDVPVIASVNGVCVGGGFDLVCLCDMVVGSTAARYQVAYAKRGLYPDMGGFWSIPRAIGWNKAIEMMTTGRFMSAEEAHAAGTRVWGLVGLPRQARRQVEAGVDVIIAQGYDSGGHSGTVGTFTLVPEVVEIAEGSDTLVLAAGGVSNGRHLAGALAMGADGIWTGTIWLATHESETEMFLKQRIIDAKVEDAVQSRAMSGKPIRQLRSNWSDAWKQPGAPEPLQMPLQGMLVDQTLAGIRQARKEDWMTTPAGQAVVGIHEIKPAAEVVYSLVEKAMEQFDRVAGEPVAGD